MTAEYDYSHTSYGKARNAAAQGAGYRDWRHLILATMNTCTEDVAAMTGYSTVTICKWRKEYETTEQRPEEAGAIWEQANPSMISRDPRARGPKTLKISVGLDRRHTTAMRQLLGLAKTTNLIVTASTITFVDLDPVAFLEKVLDGIEPQWRMNDDAFWHERLATVTDETQRRAVLIAHIRRLVVAQIERS